MKRMAFAVLALAVFSMAACSDDEPTGTTGQATTIAASSAVSQRVALRGDVVAPFTVKVTDDAGHSISGVQVAWEITSGNGSLSAGTSTTGGFGEASVGFTAGSEAGTTTVTASVEGLSGSPVTFTVSVLAAKAITVVSGSGQMGRVNQPLADSFVVRVTATDDGPLPGAVVDWTATAGGGSFSDAGSASGADGTARTVLILGAFPVPNVVVASLPATGLSANFTAQATSVQTVTVEIMDFTFKAPGGGDDVTILLGDIVRWVNLDPEQHTATSDTEPIGGAAFDSGTLNQDDEFTFTPHVRGTWVYHCEFHPEDMNNARIVVE